MVMDFLVSGVRLYGDSPWTYTRCEKSVEGCKIIVTGFDPDGHDVGSVIFYVDISDGDFVISHDYGAACALRKF